MFVTVWLILATVILIVSAVIAFGQGTQEDLFSGTMAVLGAVVMVLTMLLYPLTRRRSS